MGVLWCFGWVLPQLALIVNPQVSGLSLDVSTESQAVATASSQLILLYFELKVLPSTNLNEKGKFVKWWGIW